MTDAFIYDAVRTPRGRGKADGSLHEVTALNLASQALARDQGPQQARSGAGRRRGAGLRRSGRRGRRRHRPRRRDHGGLRRRGAGHPDQPLLRLGPRRGELRRGRGDVRPARHDDRRRRRIDEPRRHRRVRRRLAGRSVDRAEILFRAAGHFRRSDRDQIRLLARRRRRLRGREPEARGEVLGGGPLQEFGDRRSRTSTASRCSTRTSTCGRPRRCRRLAQLNPSFVQMGEMAGFDAVAIQRYPEIEAINHVHTPGNSSGIVDGAAAVLIGNKDAGTAAGLKPRARIRQFANIGSEPSIMLTGPVPVTEKVLKKAGMTVKRHRPVRAERGVRLGGAALHAGARHRRTTRSTSTAAPSPWAIRSAPPAR